MKEISLKNVLLAFKEKCSAERIAKNFPSERTAKELELMTKSFAGLSQAVDIAIKSAEGKARVRNTSVDDICRALVCFEVDCSVSAKALGGTTIEIDTNAQGFASSYKYVPLSTHVYVVFKKGYWRITDITRERCTTRMISASLSDTAKKAIIDRLETGGRIKQNGL